MKYRKKPVVIEAEVYRPGLEDGFECVISRGKTDCEMDCTNDPAVDKYRCFARRPYINTLEGKHYISPGDWIITGVKGERYACKPDIFAMTYEPVED